LNVGWSGPGDAETHQGDGVQRLGLDVLQQLAVNTCLGGVLLYRGRLGHGQPTEELVGKPFWFSV